MATQNSVFVVIAADNAIDKQRDLIDSGAFAEAKDLDYQLRSLNDKIKKLISEKGGSLLIATYDRIVMELPITVAEEMPMILDGYKQFFGDKLSAGIGMDMNEAGMAARRSLITSDIELYDPSDDAYKYDNIHKSLIPLDDVSLTPNLYDRTHPGSPKPSAAVAAEEVKYVPAPDIQTYVQSESTMIQAVMQQVNGPAEEIQQQAQQMQQQQMQQQKEEPRDMLEALNGGPVDGHNPESKEKGESKSESKPKESDSKDSDSDSDSDDSDASADQLGKLLTMVNDKMPKLMDLHESNPDAFKKVIALVHKIVDMAKKKKDSVKKSEIMDLTKAVNASLRNRFPTGTVHKRKKKVIVDGKAVWRSMVSGQVKDLQGNAISVKSSNNKDGSEEIDDVRS